jgi:hypothetical protein
MDLLDKRAKDAIAIEEGTIRELEAKEALKVLNLQPPSNSFMLNLVLRSYVLAARVALTTN